MDGGNQTEVSWKHDPIIVAIDFGTTYSGVAWIRRSLEALNPDHIAVINRWPSRIASQVRSEIEYDAKGNMLRWGYLEGRMKLQHYRFKLIKTLLPIRDVGAQRKELVQNFDRNLPDTITIRSVVRDYMNSILAYVIDQLMKEDSLPREIRKNSKILQNVMEFVITFPACWSPQTLQAYKDALGDTILKGFIDNHKVYYLKEPEAAMIGTLHAPHRRPPSLVTDLSGGVEYKYVSILDAGGGTLDFSAYKVKSWDPFKLHQIASTGDQIGGSHVDKEFWEYFMKSLRTAKVPVEKFHPRSKDAIIREFERVKHSFPSDSQYILPLPRDDEIPFNLREAHIEDGHLILSLELMRKFFDNVIVGRIIPFLNEQRQIVEKHMTWKGSVFFLVGGFGDSAYLQEKIRDWAKKNQVKLITPQNSWTAIVCGAVKFGLCRSLQQEGPVTTRISQCSIGIVRDARWDNVRNSKGARQRSRNVPAVKNQIEWLVKKGQNLETRKLQLQRTFKQWPHSWKEILVQSNEAQPSSDMHAKDVSLFGEIKVLVKGVPPFERVKSGFWIFGKFKVDYILTISFPGADVVAEMRYKGNNYGKGHFRFPNSDKEDVGNFIKGEFRE